MRVHPLLLAATLAGAAAAQSYVPPALVRVHPGEARAEAMRAVIEAGGQVVTRGRDHFEATLPQDRALLGVLADAPGARLELLDVDLDRQLERFADKADAGDYHTPAEVEAELAALAAARPDLVQIETIGTSVEGRPIQAARVSSRDAAADVPALLVCGMHHAREWIAVEVPLGILHDLVDRHDSDAATRELLATREVWIVPVLNPDGLEYSQTERRMWRKNRRPNEGGSVGVDLNRNWAYEWGGLGASPRPSSDTYRGPEAFSEPELRALRDLARREGVVASLSYHSYGELVLWPWGYDHDVAPDDATLADHARAMAALNEYEPMQSAGLYPASGDFDDWFYGELGAISFTIELGKSFVPPEEQIPTIVAANVRAARYYLAEAPSALPMFSHASPTGETNAAGPYPLAFRIARRHRVEPPQAVGVRYTAADGSTGEVPALPGEDGAYTAALPGTGLGSVAYHLAVTDAAGVARRFPAEEDWGFPVVESLTLLVDDDGGKGHERAYRAALADLGAPYQEVRTDGLTVADLLAARNVIWSCGDDSGTSLTTPERELITAYLAAGGELVLFGQDIGYATNGSAFLRDVLKARFEKDTVHATTLAGVGDGFLEGLSVTINQGEGQRQRYPDGLTSREGGAAVLAYEGKDEFAGVAVEGASKAALFGFGLEGVDGAEARRDLLGACLTWMDSVGETDRDRRRRRRAAAARR